MNHVCFFDISVSDAFGPEDGYPGEEISKVTLSCRYLFFLLCITTPVGDLVVRERVPAHLSDGLVLMRKRMAWHIHRGKVLLDDVQVREIKKELGRFVYSIYILVVYQN